MTLVFLAALATALLTFFAGFGLGTLLLPAYALFLPLDLAVAMTAIVHLGNNLFKFAMMYHHINWRTLWQFALPAIPAAFLGAWLLLHLAASQAEWTWSLAGLSGTTGPLSLSIGLMILLFALWDMGVFGKVTLPATYIPLGGMLSGFCGGLSGHQGALRSAILINCKLDKKAFIGTGVCIAILIDISRLSVYSISIPTMDQAHIKLVLTGLAGAFTGSLAGRFLLEKISLEWIHNLIGILLLVLSTLIMAGWT